MAKSDLRIDILGTTVAISADEEKEYLDKLLAKYRRTVENVERISGLKDPLKIAVLTGFLLSDDLEKAGSPALAQNAGTAAAEQNPEETGEAEKLALGMISRLDAALGAEAPFTVDAAQPQAEPGGEAANAPKKIAGVFKLQNAIKNYDWGSSDWLPELLGEENLSRIPWAELWMGVNPGGPSRAELPGGTETPLLSELIQKDPEALLGQNVAGAFGGLPFLFKVEAAAKPLSIQAHPNRGQARDGFERENRAGIPLDAPARSYRDPNHKPEIICALKPFAALCGFKGAGRILAHLDALLPYSNGPLKAGLERLASALEEGAEPLKAFLAALFNLDSEARRAIAPFIRTRQAQLERDFPEYRDEWGLCSYLADMAQASGRPDDPGILAPLYLNIIELEPGEAMYLPSGIMHAYIHGLGIELMADSDNVLRGGLTSKPVDREELFRILAFSEYKPEILKLPDPAPAWHTYPSPSEEFSLSAMRGSGGALPYPETGPSIALVCEGNAALKDTGTGGEITLNKGESVFIPAGKRGRFEFSGNFAAYVASVGKAGAGRESSAESAPAGFP